MTFQKLKGYVDEEKHHYNRNDTA
ncbi:Protein of unknown function [Bacillus cereus]|nr:Protein of unknown function [Bacillus cereus]